MSNLLPDLCGIPLNCNKEWNSELVYKNLMNIFFATTQLVNESIGIGYNFVIIFVKNAAKIRFSSISGLG